MGCKNRNIDLMCEIILHPIAEQPRIKKSRLAGTFYLHQPHYFLPPLTFAIIKMISAINPTTRKMPQTIPALKIPSTTEQLPKQKARKQAREKINNLILIMSILYPNRIPLFISLIFVSKGMNFPHLCGMDSTMYSICFSHLLFLRR